MVDAMDGTILQTAGLIVLGWFALALLVGAGLAAFFNAAHRLERELPTERQAIRDWVKADRRAPRRRRPHAA
jgi:hypothetical protein